MNALGRRSERLQKAHQGQVHRSSRVKVIERDWRYCFAGIWLALTAQAGHAEEPANSAPIEQNGLVQELPVPVPIVVIESEEAATSRQRMEEESSKREKADLIAQEGMNTATQSMAKYALAQTLLVLIGTGALIWTLFETRRMTAVTRNMSVAQIRPWISVRDVQIAELRSSSIQMTDDAGDQHRGFSLNVDFTIRNTGKCPLKLSTRTLVCMIHSIPRDRSPIGSENLRSLSETAPQEVMLVDPSRQSLRRNCDPF